MTPVPADLLAGRTILVTGATGALGRAAALAFARHGADLILVDRDAKAFERLDAELSECARAPALLLLDVATAGPEDFARAAAAVGELTERLDGLLHAGADLGALSPIEHYDAAIWSKVIAANLTAPFLLTRALLPLMKRAPDASIVYTSSDVGRRGRAYWGAYGVSCAGLEGLVQILADELEANTGIRVNSVDPGPVNWELRRRAYPAEDAQTLAPPETVVPLYLYLMGPASRGVSGRALSAQDAP